MDFFKAGVFVFVNQNYNFSSLSFRIFKLKSEICIKDFFSVFDFNTNYHRFCIKKLISIAIQVMIECSVILMIY